MKKEIKCIIFDLDRTTLNSEGKLSPKNFQALSYASQKGIHLVVATGRFLSGIPKDIKSLPYIDYIITSNGAAIYDNRRQHAIWDCHLKSSSVQKITKICSEKSLCLEVVIKGEGYASVNYVENPSFYGTSQKAIDYIKKTRIPVEDIYKTALLNKDCIQSANIIFSNLEFKSAVCDYLKKSLHDVYITSSVPSLIEISSPLAGKHNAMRYLSKLLDIPIDKFAAFGDEDNDAEMLKLAGIGIAVANASEICLSSADWITLSNDCDGVAHAIYSLLA